MNLSNPIDSTLLQNKFLNLVVVLWFWDFGRDQMGSGCSGIQGEFDVIHELILDLKTVRLIKSCKWYPIYSISTILTVGVEKYDGKYVIIRNKAAICVYL